MGNRLVPHAEIGHRGVAIAKQPFGGLSALSTQARDALQLVLKRALLTVQRLDPLESGSPRCGRRLEALLETRQLAVHPGLLDRQP